MVGGVEACRRVAAVALLAMSCVVPHDGPLTLTARTVPVADSEASCALTIGTATTDPALAADAARALAAGYPTTDCMPDATTLAAAEARAALPLGGAAGDTSGGALIATSDGGGATESATGSAVAQQAVGSTGAVVPTTGAASPAATTTPAAAATASGTVTAASGTTTDTTTSETTTSDTATSDTTTSDTTTSGSDDDSGSGSHGSDDDTDDSPDPDPASDSDGGPSGMAGWTVDGGSSVVDLDADVVRIPGGTTVIGNDNATSGRREVRLRVSRATDDAAILLRPHAPAKGGPEDVEFVLPVTDGRSPTDRRLTIDPTDWHVWTVEWSPGTLTVSVDDQEWYRTTDPSRVPSGPLDLGLQVQGGATARMDVDLVRTATAPSTAPVPVTVTVTAPADPGVASVTGATDTAIGGTTVGGTTTDAVATTSAPAATPAD